MAGPCAKWCTILGDSHLSSYVRFKWTLTEERPTIKAFDEQRWAELADYTDLPIPEVSYALMPNEGKTAGVPIRIKLNQIVVFEINDPIDGGAGARARGGAGSGAAAAGSGAGSIPGGT